MDPRIIVKIKYLEDTRRISLPHVPSFQDLLSLVRKLFNDFEGQPAVVLKYQDEENDQVTISSDVELQEAISVSSKTKPPILRLFVSIPQNKPKASPAPTPSPPTTPQPPRVNPLDELTRIFSNPQLLEQEITPVREFLSLFSNLETKEAQKNIEQLISTAKDFFTSLAPSTPQAPPATPAPSTPSMPSIGVLPLKVPIQAHINVVCDECGVRNFVGTRFKCSICADYDLCQVCHQNKVHSMHEMTAIEQPIMPFYGRAGYCRSNWGERRFSGPPNSSGFSNRRPGATKERHLARFVDDITIPDGTNLQGGQKFIKTWRLRNEGSNKWPEETKLSFVGGDQLSLVDSVVVPSIAPGGEVDISVEMVAPTRAGRFVGFWRLSQGDGIRFGQRVWVDIFVSLGEKKEEKPKEEVKEVPALVKEEEEKKELSFPLLEVKKLEVKKEEVKEVPIEEKKEVALPKVEKKEEVKEVPKVEEKKEVVVPAVEKKEVKKISSELAQLVDMGFSDIEMVSALLSANENDVFKTVQQLLNLN